MFAPSRHEISLELIGWNKGDQEAIDRLIPLVYPELKRIAHRQLMNERSGHSLQTTDLAHETYIRLVDQKAINWQNRRHFFAIAACMTRRILVDHARSKLYQKRGGGALRMSLGEAEGIAIERAADLIALDDALKTLASVDQRKALIVEMKFFGGLTLEAIAGYMNLSTKMVHREWRFSRAFLLRELDNTNRNDT